MFDGLRRTVFNIIAYKDISSALGIVLPDNSIMEQHMAFWLDCMTGNAPYLFDSKRVKQLHTLNLPATVSNEYAKMCLLEYETQITGNTRAKWLQEQHDELIKPIFNHALQWTLALGNVIFKPRLVNGRLRLDYTTYPNFVPVGWDENGLTEIIFRTDVTRGAFRYTLLEHMGYREGVFSIRNYSFKGDANSRDAIGVPVTLEDTPDWGGLEDFEVKTEMPWFVHMK